MGAAPTIQQQSEKDKEFQKYIDERNAELDKTVAAAKKDMAEQIKTYYDAGGWKDAQPLSSGAYQHLSTASTWSLDHVNAMIDAVRGAVFGSPAAPPVKDPKAPDVPIPASAAGNQVSPIDEKTKSLMSMMGEQSLLSQTPPFKPFQEYSRSSNLQRKPTSSKIFNKRISFQG